LKPLAIHQFHPAIEEFSAVSNEVFALREIFQGLGYSSEVFSSEPCTIRGAGVRKWRRDCLEPPDVLLVHYSLGSAQFHSVFSSPGRKVLIYHGVTPSGSLSSLPSIQALSEMGEGDLAGFASSAEAAIAHSHFAARDLHLAGYQNVEVLPYMLWERLYEASPTEKFVNKDPKNLLVVGRIMPHKHVEDSLFVLDYLRNRIGVDWRLILAGSYNGAEIYRERVASLAERMNLREIVWTGPVSQSALIAFYQSADAYLLTSEHECFGVPLVEAMRYDVPVFALASAAAPEVLGDAGVLFSERNWPLIAEAIHLVTRDPRRKEDVLASQRARREMFSRASSEQRWRNWLERFR
jgi:glycosyltransferase involved in cell wall biosynthesis